jgi:hypothetical protein
MDRANLDLEAALNRLRSLLLISNWVLIQSLLRFKTQSSTALVLYNLSITIIFKF